MTDTTVTVMCSLVGQTIILFDFFLTFYTYLLTVLIQCIFKSIVFTEILYTGCLKKTCAISRGEISYVKIKVYFYFNIGSEFDLFQSYRGLKS